MIPSILGGGSFFGGMLHFLDDVSVEGCASIVEFEGVGAGDSLAWLDVFSEGAVVGAGIWTGLIVLGTTSAGV